MWAGTRVHEPPGSRGNGGKANVASNDEIAEEEPARDERVLDVAWRLVHDVYIRRVEAEGSCRETVSDEIDPE